MIRLRLFRARQFKKQTLKMRSYHRSGLYYGLDDDVAPRLRPNIHGGRPGLRRGRHGVATRRTGGIGTGDSEKLTKRLFETADSGHILQNGFMSRQNCAHWWPALASSPGSPRAVIMRPATAQGHETMSSRWKINVPLRPGM